MLDLLHPCHVVLLAYSVVYHGIYGVLCFCYAIYVYSYFGCGCNCDYYYDSGGGHDYSFRGFYSGPSFALGFGSYHESCLGSLKLSCDGYAHHVALVCGCETFRSTALVTWKTSANGSASRSEIVTSSVSTFAVFYAFDGTAIGHFQGWRACVARLRCPFVAPAVAWARRSQTPNRA